MLICDNRFETCPKERPLTAGSTDFDHGPGAFSLHDSGFEIDDITDAAGCQETALAAPEYDIGLVHRAHCGKVGGTEDKAAVDQSLVIGRHLLRCHQTDMRKTFSNLHRFSAESVIDLKVRVLLHQLPFGILVRRT